MYSTPLSTSSESQKRWRDHMHNNYISSHSIRPCVFHVPENLRESKPEAYTPQLLGLGPYHHFRAEVQHMESYKRDAVIAYQTSTESSTSDDRNRFSQLVEKGENTKKFEHKTRACYDRCLYLDKETLAWVVIVDGLFLLHLINTCLNFEKLRQPKDGPNEESDPVSESEKKLANHPKFGALVADAFMLENQIPIILILEMRTFLHENFSIKADEKLLDKIGRFCRQQSPLQLTKDVKSINETFDKSNHVLHFMYQMIVKNKCGYENKRKEINVSQIHQEENGATSRSSVRGLAREYTSQGREILGHAIEEINAALSDAKSAGIKVSGSIEKVSNILRNVEKAFHLHTRKDSLGDEIGIPSASRLNAILKITFKPLPDCCGIEDIDLDDEQKELYLPVITLTANSEVILRNLAAYEKTAKMGSTQFRDYVDLMCGIIKSEKDVKLLRDAKIITGEVVDREIVRMCSGFKKSDEKPDEKSKPHATVIKVIDHFNKAGFVKSCRSITKFFAASVKIFRPLFGLAVVLLLALQSFCEFYDCRRSWHGGRGAAALRDLYLGELDLDPSARLLLPRKVYRYY